MQAIGSILVVMNPSQSEELALKRAKLIAGVTQSRLHLLVCDKRGEHGQYLERVSQELTEDGYEVTSQQAWHESFYETIIKVQQAEGCGLVIKQHFPENPFKRALLTPDDWKLLRYCPSPVLIAKTKRPWTEGTVLVAVDVGNSSSEHKALHANLISSAYEVASIAKATMHIFSAHPSPMLSASDPTFQLRETIEARYREQCVNFVKEFELEDEQMHIKEGPADILIPEMAKQLDAVVTVIGTVARTGISGALIGNTAEVVLDAVETDVLILKPQSVVQHLEKQLEK
ncbi:universal stress protein [Denitrificimonas sp. JX-1]|uniref:Universal stress protein n=1 Tax=Denitrificimonas halotolerans TaxID=3098930 RepID=A0ABU5GPJ8_9GAMM|nr:universal stress protein [Denitrificimonas sp. JX-1]MDY7218901.1 universal stress protein [Denitrificimonas sp. JX-1]